jgi:Na+-driven multidrug efflux pump
MLLPLAWLLGVVLDLGLLGVWASAATYVVLLTVIMAFKWKGGSWKTISI